MFSCRITWTDPELRPRPLPGISALSWSAPDLRHSGLHKSPEGSTSHVLLQINIAKHSKGIYEFVLVFFFFLSIEIIYFVCISTLRLSVSSDRLRSLFKKKKKRKLWIFYGETPGSTLCVWKSKLKSKGYALALLTGSFVVGVLYDFTAVPTLLWSVTLVTLVPVTTTWQLQFMQILVHDGMCSWAVLDYLCAICFPWEPQITSGILTHS